MTNPETDDFIVIRATLPTIPFPLNNARPTITTDRLLIRPLQPDDLQALHTLRTQEEVMKWTAAERIDRDIEETRSKLATFLPPNDAITANCAICLRHTGELIGLGGCHLFLGEHGWPEVGYMLRKEFWGQGIATEFLTAWLRFWEQLPRSEREVKVRRDMVAGAGTVGEVVEERLVGLVLESNVSSQAVLRKSGFERFCDLGDGLIAFCYFPSNSKHHTG